LTVIESVRKTTQTTEGESILKKDLIQPPKHVRARENKLVKSKHLYDVTTALSRDRRSRFRYCVDRNYGWTDEHREDLEA
jgi:hypothetical protein